MMDYFQWCERVLAEYLAAAQDSLEARSEGLRPDQVARRIFGSEAVEKDGFLASSEWEGLKQAIKDLDDEGYILTDDAYYGDEPHLPARFLVRARSFSEKRKAAGPHGGRPAPRPLISTRSTAIFSNWCTV